jgi:hypothetical protein
MVQAQSFSRLDNENPCHHLRVWGNVFVPEHLGHDTRNSKVKIIFLFSHGEGEGMVCPCRRKYEWGLRWT